MDAALPERGAPPAQRRVRWWSVVEATASGSTARSGSRGISAGWTAGGRARGTTTRDVAGWVGFGSRRGRGAKEAGGGCERVKLDAISRRLDRRLGGERGGRGRRTRTHLCRGLRAILAVVRVSAVVSKACALRCGRSEHGLVGVSRLPRSRATHPHARVGPPASKPSRSRGVHEGMEGREISGSAAGGTGRSRRASRTLRKSLHTSGRTRRSPRL